MGTAAASRIEMRHTGTGSVAPGKAMRLRVVRLHGPDRHLHRLRFSGREPMGSGDQWYGGVAGGTCVVQGSVGSGGLLSNLSSLVQRRGHASDFVRQLTDRGVVRRLYVRAGTPDTERLLRFYGRLGFERAEPS